jgi:plasmid stability protein
MPRFELGTSCTPSRRATRLRYIPSGTERQSFYTDCGGSSGKISRLIAGFDIVISFPDEEVRVAQFVVRDLEDSVAKKLKERARRHSRSMEDEVRHILRAAVHRDQAVPKQLGSRIAARFTTAGLTGDLPEFRGVPARPARLEE